MTGPRHVQPASGGGPLAAEAPWTDLDPPEPLDGPPTVKRTATSHRVTQEALDRMAGLRRQGATLQDVAAQLGCSERTVRRYAGRVERQLVPPSPQIPEDTDAQRAALVGWYTKMLGRLWDRFPSVALVDEAVRQLVERIRSLRPETVRLLMQSPKMQFQLFREAVGPLFSDYAAFEQVVHFLQQLPDHKPLFWRPGRKWIQGDDDEAGDP